MDGLDVQAPFSKNGRWGGHRVSQSRSEHRRTALPFFASMILHGLSSLLLACWSGQSSGEDAHFTDTLNLRRIQVARQAQVHCGAHTDCPEGVGLWTALEPKALPSQCTSFLIGPDLLLTNHHCLPLQVRKPGTDCRGLAWVHFPRLGDKPADSVSCGEVVALSTTSERIDQSDWALVRLARRVARKPLSLARDGVRDRDSLVSWVCNPDWGLLVLREQISAELRPLTCLASRRTRAFHDPGSTAEFSDSLSRRIPLASCPAQKGNSGAPVLRRDQDGNWRVHALLDRSAPVNGVRDWARSQGIALLDTCLGEFAYATNLSCIPLPGWPDVPGICHRDSSRSAVQQQRDALKSEIDSAIAVQLVSIPSSLPLRGKILQRGAWPGFARGLAHPETNPEALIVPLPACSSPGTTDSLFHIPVWSMRFGFDRDLRWSFRMDLDRPRVAVLRRCKSLGLPSAGLDLCRFDARFPEIGALPLSTDTLTRCADPRSASATPHSIF